MAQARRELSLAAKLKRATKGNDNWKLKKETVEICAGKYLRVPNETNLNAYKEAVLDARGHIAKKEKRKIERNAFLKDHLFILTISLNPVSQSESAAAIELKIENPELKVVPAEHTDDSERFRSRVRERRERRARRTNRQPLQLANLDREESDSDLENKTHTPSLPGGEMRFQYEETLAKDEKVENETIGTKEPPPPSWEHVEAEIIASGRTVSKELAAVLQGRQVNAVNEEKEPAPDYTPPEEDKPANQKTKWKFFPCCSSNKKNISAPAPAPTPQSQISFIDKIINCCRR